MNMFKLLDSARKADPKRDKPQQVAAEIKAFENLLTSLPK